MSEYRARITPEGKIFYLQTELDALRAENQRLKLEREHLIEAGHQIGLQKDRLYLAARAVIDSINDENEIDPDALYALSRALEQQRGVEHV